MSHFSTNDDLLQDIYLLFRRWFLPDSLPTKLEWLYGTGVSKEIIPQIID